MYTLSENQISFILDDIRRRGIESEDLQSNLLDHICCIVEHELEENGDFEQFYFTMISRFYRKDLKEVEEEIKSLLLFKNYYAMKKTMFGAGTISAFFMSIGIMFKFMHYPGAAALIFAGIITFSLIFLPLHLLLRIRERKEIKDRLLTITGVASGIFLSLGVLFKIMHWPMANILGFSAAIGFLLFFLPLYFFTGIRNQQNKESVIINSVIILMGCGLFLTLVRTSQNQEKIFADQTRDYIQQEQLLVHELMLTNQDSVGDASFTIFKMCDELKSMIVRLETGVNELPADALEKNLLFSDKIVNDYYDGNTNIEENITSLRKAISEYNQKTAEKQIRLPDNLDSKELRSVAALEGLVRIQLALLQNNRVK